MIQPAMPSSSPYEAPNSEFKVLVCDLRFNVSTTIEYIPVFSRSAVLRERVGDDHGVSTPSFAAVGDGLWIQGAPWPWRWSLSSTSLF